MPVSVAVNPLPDCDVLVIGGGPAGATIAALLAEQGKSVTLIEKDKHPRFHIGESLLPCNLPLFDQLGIHDAIEKIGMPKYGIEFVSPHHNHSSMLEFSRSWHKDMVSSYQVRRSEFDHILLKNAAVKGATVVEETRVSEISFAPGGATVTALQCDGSTLTIHARFIVDATGRDTFLANRLQLKRRNRRHASAAIYGHFKGAVRLTGQAEGHISIFWFERGWFWFIPLADGTTSVGAVCKPDYLKMRGENNITAFFTQTIALCPALVERLRSAELIGSATATGNFSYDCGHSSGENYILIGDASAFIDPVFSTGVYLAMKNAFDGAEAVLTCLDRPREAAKALRKFERHTRKGLGKFKWFIYRMNSPVIRELFMAPRNPLRIGEAVMALLAGDIAANSAIQSRLVLFKAIYYFKTILLKLPAALPRMSKTHQPVN